MINAYNQENTSNKHHYMLYVAGVFMMLLLIYVIFNQENKTARDIQLSGRAKGVETKEFQKKHVNLPPLKPIANVLTHTVAVGTPDNPTIDGGFINAADGLPVNIPQLTQPAKDQAILLLKNTDKKTYQNLPGKIGGAFQDEWATSARVKAFLKNAAEGGKLAYVLDRVEQKGLPASVAVVPMVESNYQSNATSNKGAGGAWQLMPQTARGYGLNGAERYQFAPATDAALNLLQDLHKQFGNWQLAFAAYNAGADRVTTALAKNPQATSINELSLPQETKAYVARIMALNKTFEAL